MTTTLLPLIYKDLTPLISNAFSRSLIEDGVAGDRWQPDTIEICCPDIEEAAVDGMTIEDAWWYDPTIPESAGFAGPIMDRRFTNLTKGWTTVGTKIVPASRNLTTRLVLYAIDELSLQYGINATMAELGVSSAPGMACARFEGALYLGCDDQLRRTFCGARILSCEEVSVESGDEFDLSGIGCPVGCVLDVVIDISNGCLWGSAEVAEAPTLTDEPVQMCNPNAIAPGACCSDIASLLGSAQVSCAPIDPAYLCEPGTLTPVDTAQLCDPFCPPLYLCRTVMRITAPAGLEYGASFSIENSSNNPLLQTELTIYPASLFDNAGIDPADPALAGITGCVQPELRARVPYLPPRTTIARDGRCGKTTAVCSDAADQLPYRPSELFSVSGTPTGVTLQGGEDWIVFVDTKCVDNPAATDTRVLVYLTPCYLS